MSLSEFFTQTILLAWKEKIDITQLLSYATQLDEQKFGVLAIVLYQTWLERNETSPYFHAVCFNLGVLLSNEGELVAAERAYRRAIEADPNFIQPRLNLGSLYERMGKIDQALAEWRWVKDNVVQGPETYYLITFALNHLGRVLENQKQYNESEAMLTLSLKINPNQPDALQHWIHLRQKQCEWPIFMDLENLPGNQMMPATSALAMLSVTDDPKIQLDTASNYVAAKVLANVAPLANPHGYQHDKIRVAYCSSDFSLHPVSMLTVELFELHNRDQFEVYGFCWSPEDGSDLRKRVINAMDHFTRINHLSDEQAAHLIREQEIDILVDLQGLTSGTRPNILSYKPAPIQITYLGLPATTGLWSIDYIIVDHYLVPEQFESYYSEKLLYLSPVFQMSDRQRVAAEKPTRESCGLPEDAFVFCSFNNNYKFTQEVFTVWMNILHRVSNSVLWLLADNPWAEINLRREAQNFGIAPERLIFMKRTSPKNYLARYLCADLFLDTFPFNAGTTANDALWMGLPLLTYSGRTFAARMAGSLLSVAGLRELITHNLQEYEEKAVWLAAHPEYCRTLRERLFIVRHNGVLFDIPLLVRNLESHFKQLVAERRIIRPCG